MSCGTRFGENPKRLRTEWLLFPNSAATGGKWMLRPMHLMIYLEFARTIIINTTGTQANANSVPVEIQCFLLRSPLLYKNCWIAISRRDACILWWGKFSYYFLFITFSELLVAKFCLLNGFHLRKCLIKFRVCQVILFILIDSSRF